MAPRNWNGDNLDLMSLSGLNSDFRGKCNAALLSVSSSSHEALWNRNVFVNAGGSLNAPEAKCSCKTCKSSSWNVRTNRTGDWKSRAVSVSVPQNSDFLSASKLILERDPEADKSRRLTALLHVDSNLQIVSKCLVWANMSRVLHVFSLSDRKKAERKFKEDKSGVSETFCCLNIKWRWILPQLHFSS